MPTGANTSDTSLDCPRPSGYTSHIRRARRYNGLLIPLVAKIRDSGQLVLLPTEPGCDRNSYEHSVGCPIRGRVYNGVAGRYKIMIDGLIIPFNFVNPLE